MPIAFDQPPTAGGATAPATAQTRSFGDFTWSPATLAVKARLQRNVPGLFSTVTGTAGDDVLYGSNQSDLIEGLDGSDTLYGLGDDDVLYGGSGDNILFGGSGADHLYGGEGNDFYYFNIGDGQDRVYSADSIGQFIEVVHFGAGIDPAQVTLARVGADLIVNYGSGDAVTVVGFFPGGEDPWPRGVDEIWFHEGAAWDVSEILARLPPGQGI
ncbi:calcium-binding protein [Lysobacter sp. TAB13]|uniref:calcium-binding protein n=1 Tax=Lysobacter sp. TAB13 TaxID=3233065 RepID=UPI003F9775C2